MSAVLALLVGALATWLLRAGFIAVVPAERLPRPVREALPHAGPAVLGALVVGALVHGAGPAALAVPTPAHAALLVAALVAWRTRNLAAPMVAAVLVVLAIDLLSR